LKINHLATLRPTKCRNFPESDTGKKLPRRRLETNLGNEMKDSKLFSSRQNIASGHCSTDSADSRKTEAGFYATSFRIAHQKL
jgi:hypothetical protein